MGSIFLKNEGYTIKNRILDFLIVHQEFDYSLTDIAKLSNVSYTTMKRMKDSLIKEKWIIKTRTVGKAEMYKLNLKCKKVQKFIEFYWSVIESESECDKSASPTSALSGTSAVPMSARHL